MELSKMIFQRLLGDESLSELLAQFDERSAIFYQRPPSDAAPEWGKVQYPRIDYNVDLQENPARNTSGVLSFNITCDIQVSCEPEDIEARLRELFHTAFVPTDDYVYCIAWLRSDAFEVKTREDQTVRNYGVTVTFDLVACPPQVTVYPDPIKGMNDWTKTVLPDAVVINVDEIKNWLMPTREKPVIYWRIASMGKAAQHFTHTWLDITIEGHVYCKNAADRLYNLVQINTAYALAQHITLEDTSPLFLKSFVVQPHLNYIIAGQIRASGTFGILQPESHLSTNATGEKLVRINLPREIVEEDAVIAEITDEPSEGFKFRYPQSASSEQAGQRPTSNMVGAISNASIGADGGDSQGFSIEYQMPGTDQYPE